jgi:lysozyme
MDLDSALSIAVPLTAGFEGFRPSPYWDVNGYAIGYGNHYYSDGTPVSADDDPITKEDATWLLSYTLSQVSRTLAPMVTAPVTDNTFAALMDLAYNWGTGGVGNSKLLQLINSGASDQDISDQWKKTAITSGGVLNSTLVTRRAKEASLALTDPAGSLGITALVLAGAFIAAFIILTTAKKRR